VNPDVDGYTKTLNHHQILRKTQKTNENQTNTINWSICQVGARVLHLL